MRSSMAVPPAPSTRAHRLHPDYVARRDELAALAAGSHAAPRVIDYAEHEDATLILDAFHSWNTESNPGLLLDIPVERISHYHIDDASPDLAIETRRVALRRELEESKRCVRCRTQLTVYPSPRPVALSPEICTATHLPQRRLESHHRSVDSMFSNRCFRTDVSNRCSESLFQIKAPTHLSDVARSSLARRPVPE